MPDLGGMSADQINASMGFGPGGVGAQGQSQLNNIFGNFGQQTDYYSGLGAAYGRNVGEPSGMGSVFDQSAYGMQPQQPQAPSQPNAPSGGGGVYRSAPGGGLYLDMGDGGSSFNDRFGAAPPIDYRLQPTPAQQLPQGIYDGRFAPSQPPRVNIGDDFQSRFDAMGGGGGGGGVYRSAPGGGLYLDMSGGGGSFAPPSGSTPGGSFAPPPQSGQPQQPNFSQRFGQPAGQPYYPGYFDNTFGSVGGAGMPSQYTASPYTNTQGQTFQPNLPPGFESQFGPDNPTGALNPSQLRPQVMEGRS
jgi:hypothetical protein